MKVSSLRQDEPAAKDDSTEDKAEASSASQDAGNPTFPNKDLSRRIALASTIGAVGLFAYQRLDFGGVSLKDLAANATPYEEVCSLSPMRLIHLPITGKTEANNVEFLNANCNPPTRKGEQNLLCT